MLISRRIAVLVAFSLLTTSYLVWFAFPVFFVHITRDFGWLRAETASAFSIFTIAVGGAGLVVGRLSDKVGVRTMVLVGGTLLSLSLVGISVVRSLWAFRILFGVGCGIGAGAIGWVPTVAYLRIWYEEKLGLATGVASVGISLAILTATPISHYKDYGFSQDPR